MNSVNQQTFEVINEPHTKKTTSRKKNQENQDEKRKHFLERNRQGRNSD